MAGNMNDYLGINSFGKLPDGSEMPWEEQHRTVVNAIGLDNCIKYLPKGGVERFAEALRTNEHLNNIPLVEWDACYRICTSTRKARFAMEQDIKRRVEKSFAREMQEQGLTIKAFISIGLASDEEDSKDFTVEMLKLGINSLSPSVLVSTLKCVAKMWVERECAND